MGLFSTRIPKVMICPSVWHLILRTDVDFWDSFGEEKKALPVSE